MNCISRARCESFTAHGSVARRDGAVLAFGMGAYCVVTGALMWQSLVIGGSWVGSHHYFELIDGLACFAAAASLGAAWKASTRRRTRGLILAVTAALALQHLRLWFRAIAKLEELVLYAG